MKSVDMESHVFERDLLPQRKPRTEPATPGVFCEVCQRWFPGPPDTRHQCLAKLRIGDRYVGEAYDNASSPMVWHINPDCGAMAGRAVVKLTVEHQAEIEKFTGKLLRPCRLCSK